MKRIVNIMIISIIFVLLLCAWALADDYAPGIYEINTVQGCTLVPLCSDGTKVSAETNTIDSGSVVFYRDAEMFEVNIDSVSLGAFYLITVQTSEDAPTAENVVYINQSVSSGNSLSFTVYPSSLMSGKTYYIYLSSNTDGGARRVVASFKYTGKCHHGDADNNGDINTEDASLILQHCVKKIHLEGNCALAADVDKDGFITSYDASLILQYCVGKSDIS